METANNVEHFKILLTGTVAMTILVVIIVLFVVKYQKQKIREQDTRRILIESNQEKVLATILYTQEEERKRIARDLHDELGNTLAIAKMIISQLIKTLPDVDNKKTANQMYSLIDETLKNVRRLSKDLHPVMLEKYGLVAAIEALAKKCSTNGLAIKVTTSGELTGIPSDQELNIYRIVQELFSNALRHSQASNVEVSLEVLTDHLLIHYADNGIGFDPLKYNQENSLNTGIGMLTIDARVRILKGSWELKSEKNKGTKVIFQFSTIS